MSTSKLFAHRASAVRAAKRECGADQEWVIVPVADGFTYQVLDVEEKQPEAPAVETLEVVEEVKVTVTEESLDRADAVLASQAARLQKMADEAKIAKKLAAVVKKAAQPAVVDGVTLKPFQLAKQIVAKMTANGCTSRKEIIAACIEAGVKYNTADGAHYQMCVRKS